MVAPLLIIAGILLLSIAATDPAITNNIGTGINSVAAMATSTQAKGSGQQVTPIGISNAVPLPSASGIGSYQNEPGLDSRISVLGYTKNQLTAACSTYLGTTNISATEVSCNNALFRFPCNSEYLSKAKSICEQEGKGFYCNGSTVRCS